MDLEDSTKQSSRGRLSGSGKASVSKRFGVLTDIVNGSTNTALKFDESNEYENKEEKEQLLREEMGKQIEFNKWLEEMRENYLDFLEKIKESNFPFFNLPLAVTNAFKELLI